MTKLPRPPCLRKIETASFRNAERPLHPGSWALGRFLPDGHALMVATTDNDVFAWATRLDKWVERACAIAGRNLTSAE